MTASILICVPDSGSVGVASICATSCDPSDELKRLEFDGSGVGGGDTEGFGGTVVVVVVVGGTVVPVIGGGTVVFVVVVVVVDAAVVVVVGGTVVVVGGAAVVVVVGGGGGLYTTTAATVTSAVMVTEEYVAESVGINVAVIVAFPAEPNVIWLSLIDATSILDDI